MKKNKMMAAGFMLIFTGLLLTSLACNSTPAPTTPASTANCTVKYGLQTPQPTVVPMGAGFFLAQFVDIPLSVTAKSLNILTDAGGSSDYIRVAVYSDNAGVPGTKLVESGSVAVSPSTWNNITIADTVLAPGSYWIAFLFQTGQFVNLKGSGGFYYYASPITYGTLPASFPSGSGGVGKIVATLGVCQ